MPKTKPKPVKLEVRVDPKLKKAFKSVCALQGITMEDAVEEYMRRKVARFGAGAVNGAHARDD